MPGLAPVRFPTAGLLDQLAAKGALKPTTLFDNVGYGLTSYWPTSYTFPQGRMRSTSKFSGLRRTRMELLANAKAGYGGVCFFDSGAPVLRHQTDTAVAITSGGDALCVALNTPARLDIPDARGFYGAFVQLP